MRSTIAITAGDPAGIGLEVVLKSISSVLPLARWVVLTDRLTFQRNTTLFDPHVQYRWIDRPSEITDESLLFLRNVPGEISSIGWGEQSADAGSRALAYLEEASALALRGEVDAIVTAPVSKESIGGVFRGQTDFLAERAGVREYAMAFFAPSFKVVLATI